MTAHHKWAEWENGHVPRQPEIAPLVCPDTGKPCQLDCDCREECWIERDEAADRGDWKFHRDHDR